MPQAQGLKEGAAARQCLEGRARQDEVKADFQLLTAGATVRGSDVGGLRKAADAALRYFQLCSSQRISESHQCGSEMD